MTVLGKGDPRALKGEALEEARRNTDKWHDLLGIAPQTPAQKAAYERDLAAVLDIIGYDEDDA